MNQYEPKDALEAATLGAYNQMLKEAFGESLEGPAEYELVNLPRVTLTKGISIHQWVLQKFRVGGINTDLYALHQGMTQGMRNDKGIYWLSHLGTILDFSVPRGFVLVRGGNLEITPLRNSGHQPGTSVSSPMLAQYIEEIRNAKFSKFASLANQLPRKNKYQMSGLNALTLESEVNPALHVIPRHGKTIVTVNFLSYIPNNKKTKGYQIPIPIDGKDRKHEVGTTYPPNLADAYHMIRSIQDIPEFMKTSNEVVAEVPQWSDKGKGQGADMGGLSSFLALELARQVYDPDRGPLTFAEYAARQASLNTVIQPLANNYGDIAHIFDTKHKQ